jgi:hypothetical protein
MNLSKETRLVLAEVITLQIFDHYADFLWFNLLSSQVRIIHKDSENSVCCRKSRAALLIQKGCISHILIKTFSKKDAFQDSQWMPKFTGSTIP